MRSSRASKRARANTAAQERARVRRLRRPGGRSQERCSCGRHLRVLAVEGEQVGVLDGRFGEVGARGRLADVADAARRRCPGDRAPGSRSVGIQTRPVARAVSSAGVPVETDAAAVAARRRGGTAPRRRRSGASTAPRVRRSAGRVINSPEAQALFGVEADGRLVEHEQRGVAEQRLGDQRDPPAHPTRELPDAAVSATSPSPTSSSTRRTSSWRARPVGHAP